MFGYKHYVPILKGKKGDFWSLQHAKSLTGDVVTPLIEVVPPTAKSTEAKHLTQTAQMLAGSRQHRRSFVDLKWRDNAPFVSPGSHVVDHFFAETRSRSTPAIPVTSLLRSPAFQTAVQRVVAIDQRGMALRLELDRMELGASELSAIDRLLTFMHIVPTDADLILDFGSVFTTPSALLAQNARSAMLLLPHLTAWRTLTVAAGSFPESVTVLPQATWSKLPRKEWTAWLSVVTGGTRPPRLPTYSDYAIGHPNLPFTGQANISVNLRYSFDDQFFVWRGFATTSHPLGHGQIIDICKDLVARSEFAGPNFSQGDQEIQARATTPGSTGGPQQWRQWATNHYLELVASQLATVPSP